MVLTVTLNPCIDRTLFLDGLNVGGHNVVKRLREDVSGKGINVNVVLQNLNIKNRAVGFEFTRSGAIVADFLGGIGVDFYEVPVDAKLRVNTKVFDERRREMTELNCSGPLLGKEEENKLMKAFEAALEGCSVLVVDGSVPPGISKDIYGRMIGIAKEQSVYTILDAGGELFFKALSAKPDMVKPNKAELEQLLGIEINNKQQAVDACYKLMDMGAKNVCLSLGPDGAMLVSREGAWYSCGLDIEVKSFQGAGDSVVAGICYAIEKGLDCPQQLQCGVSAAHGSLLLEGTLLCTAESFHDLLPQITVESLC